MLNQTPALLVLADGTKFRGRSIGVSGQAVGEVVFNTTMSGYQEVLTDPSYTQQIVTFTYPHIGNTGINPDDVESARVSVAGLVIRDLPLLHSNWRSTMSLSAYLHQNRVVTIADIDTRQLTRILRERGVQSGCIMAGGELDEDEALHRAQSFPGLAGADLAQGVSTLETYTWTEPEHVLMAGKLLAASTFHVVVYDFGVKSNILRMLVSRGCSVTVVPARTCARDVLAYQPHGVLLSNGPGDPGACDYAIQSIRELLEADMPIYGICLGHQLLALACGARTVKMKFGHHGANHPVQELDTGRVFITSQNHGFSVDKEGLPAHLKATHVSLFDGSLQGISHQSKPAFGFQGHPEASPGPMEIGCLFDRFLDSMQQKSVKASS